MLLSTTALHCEQVCREWHRQVLTLRQELTLSDLPPVNGLAAFSHVTDLHLALPEQTVDPLSRNSLVWLSCRAEQLAALAYLRRLTLIAQWGDRGHRPAAALITSMLCWLPRLGELTGPEHLRIVSLLACPGVVCCASSLVTALRCDTEDDFHGAESLEVRGWCFHAEAVKLPQLRRLVLTNCRFELAPWDALHRLETSTVGLVALLGLQPAVLTTLHVHCCVAAGTGPQLAIGLRGFSRLTSLSLAGSIFVCDEFAAEAGGLAALVDLDLSTPHACRHPKRGGPFASSTWGQLSPAAAAALVAGPRGGLRSSLRSLTLRGQAGIGDSGAAALSGLTALTRLDIGMPHAGLDVGLGDQGAQALARGLTNLRVLRLGECRLDQRGCAALGRLTRLTGALVPGLLRPSRGAGGPASHATAV